MKLLFCPECKDIVKLVLDEYRQCWCQESLGVYIDDLTIRVEGPAIVLGVNNFKFRQAIDHPGWDVASIFRIVEPYDKIIRSEPDDNEST